MQKLANHIIYIANKNNLPIKGFHLQKILYFLLRNSKSYLPKEQIIKIYTEPFLVWHYGPIVESIYNKYLTYGLNSILEAGEYSTEFENLDSEILRYLKIDSFRMIEASKTHAFWQLNKHHIKNGRSYIEYTLDDILKP